LSNQLLPATIANPQGSLEAYIQSANSFPVLSADEEKDLAYRLKLNDDLNAARQLILSHLRFVVQIARGYSGYGLAQADLIQEGNIGLMKAVKRFDPEQGVRLISFAVHWIRAEMHEFILRNWKIVKVATTKAQRKLFFNLRKNKKRLGWFNQAEVDAVADKLGVSGAQVREMEMRLSQQDASFDGYGNEDDDDHYTAPAPSAFLQAQAADPASIWEKSDSEDHHSDQLSNALDLLDERSQDILQQRWLSEDKATLQELAEKYSVSAERIRQLEQNAIAKLRQQLVA